MSSRKEKSVVFTNPWCKTFCQDQKVEDVALLLSLRWLMLPIFFHCFVVALYQCCCFIPAIRPFISAAPPFLCKPYQAWIDDAGTHRKGRQCLHYDGANCKQQLQTVIKQSSLFYFWNWWKLHSSESLLLLLIISPTFIIALYFFFSFYFNLGDFIFVPVFSLQKAPETKIQPELWHFFSS